MYAMGYPSKDFDRTNLEGWLKCKRDDLNAIPKMVAKGYTVEFDYRDINAKRITPDNVPHDAVSFSKGDFHIWKGYKSSYNPNSIFRDILGYWICATLDNGYFVKHIHFPFLSMAVKYEKTL